MQNLMIFNEIALQEQRRLLEMPAPKVERPIEPNRTRSLRTVIGQMLITMGHRLAPSQADAPPSVASAPAS